MDSVKPSSAPKKSKLARTLSKVMNLQTATINSNCYSQKPKSQDKANEDRIKCFWPFDQEVDIKSRNMAAMEAFIAKLFACVSSIKAAYAELQIAQFPYNGDAIQCADQAVVNELKTISELKRSYLKKQLNISPQVTMLLAEMQEQQSLMKTYEISMKKLESDAQSKESEINSLKKDLDVVVSTNNSIEKTLHSSGSLSVLSGVLLPDLNPNHFVTVLQYTLRSIRSFVKIMIGEMESAKWNLTEATQSIEPEAEFAKPSHRCFAFESFVCRVMFDGFNVKKFSVSGESIGQEKDQNRLFFEEFTRLRSANPKSFISRNPNSSFAKFVRSKYLNLVHPKMECSLFGNLNQRSHVNNGNCPDSAFFTAFAEMAKRVWVLHCLGFSFETGVGIFQVQKNSRFSEVYMESVTEEVFRSSNGDFRVVFTVVPGFTMGKTVIQCQVYVSPAPAICLSI